MRVNMKGFLVYFVYFKAMLMFLSHQAQVFLYETVYDTDIEGYFLKYALKDHLEQWRIQCVFQQESDNEIDFR